MRLEQTLLPVVLVVDDSAVTQDIIRHALSPTYCVLAADNAVKALEIIYHQPIAALILDVAMPDVDGLELCRTLRRLPQFKDLPIIMLTAKDGMFDKVQGRLAGATEYLTKPFETDYLQQVLDRYISPLMQHPGPN